MHGALGGKMLLPEKDWDALMTGVVQQKYQLILGAGASVGATTSRGTPVMAGSDLTDALIRDFGLPKPKDPNLRRVYAAAQGHKSVAGTELSTYLQDLYTGCQAPAWYRHLVAIPWKYIWTLNIDDVLENAYSIFDTQARNKLVSLSWTQNHRIPNPDEVIAIHLHGKASRARNPEELIFDISMYLRATTDPHRWHSIFEDSYSDAPAIVLGASLREEFDLQTVLEQGRLRDRDLPSIIALKTIDEFDRQEYERWGLTAIEATAEELIKAIAEDWPEYALRFAPATAEAAEQISPSQLAFLHQWDRLDPPLEHRTDSRHDFFSGHEPSYDDILNHLDFERNGFSNLRDKFLQERPRQQVACIYGATFSGKTSLSLRLCRSMAEAGWTVYNFDPDLRPDLEAVIWWIRRSPKTVLYIEGIADFSPEIGDLIARCTSEGIPLRLVVVERESRMKEVRRFIRGEAVQEWQMSPRLRKSEVERLLNVLKENARLGSITGMAAQAQREYFLSQHRGDLFSALSDLESGEGFLERIHRRLVDVGYGPMRTLAHLTAIVSTIGYGLPFGVAMSAAGISPRELTRILATESFAEIVEVRRGKLYPRHRVFGSHLIDREFSQEENFTTTLALAKHLAPHVSPAAIHAKTIEYRLARQLLDWELLGRWLGRDRMLHWYAAIQDLYDWNARYWEQRALAASNLNLHERAVSWAQRAIAEHRDAFALNTLATVILRRGLERYNNRNEQMDLYLEAVALLEEARAIAPEDSEYPFITFFKYSIEFARSQRKRGEGIDGRIVQRWNNWWYSAQNSSVFHSTSGQSPLQQLQRNWLRLTVQ
jgi:hypothetical protein